ncbi:hypothetical protein RND71_044226 [Anisodus tanguticus]|uniref:Uncharacterized protein n=1 Tax=Anisodus tanguticus TaxID=243964 RepID=A0AAE1QNT1_9SOLA|nr:hypothetical protein RND71_044226 [Anisodus tanguticus]
MAQMLYLKSLVFSIYFDIHLLIFEALYNMQEFIKKIIFDIVDLSKHRNIKMFTGHSNDVLDANCSKDSSFICSASEDKNVFMINIETILND